MDWHAHKSTGATLLDASDTFVTFLYAASVHLVIARAVEGQPTLTVWSAALVLVLVLFLFSDWLSRVRLPRLLPDRTWYEPLGKALLEISGLFCLVIACLVLIGVTPDEAAATAFEGSPNAASAILNISTSDAFAGFLIFTFLWNLLMLRVMKDLSWLELARASLTGTAIDLRAGQIYAQQFWHFRTRVCEELKYELKYETDRGPTVVPGLIFKRSTWAMFKLALASSFVQFLCIHIAFTSAIAGCALLAVHGTRDQPVLVWLSELVPNGQMFVDRIRPVIRGANLFSASTIVFGACLIWMLKPHKRLRDRLGISFGILAAALAVLYRSTWVTGAPLSYATGAANLLLVPAGLFFFREFFDGKGKDHFGWAVGIPTCLVLLVTYLSVKPQTLMAIVALQQVVFSAFLQYAATRSDEASAPGAFGSATDSTEE